jgi:Tol biopolymer transport system component
MGTRRLRLVICACGLSLLMLAVTILSLGLAAAHGVGSLTRVTTASGSNRDSRGPSVSADGTIVAFYSDSDFLGQGIQDEQYEIWLYDTTTMTLTSVTWTSDSIRGSYDPSLSADGTIVAFPSDSDFLGQGILDEQYEIWLYDTTTMTFTRVTTASDSNRDSYGPSVSADGTKVAFFSDSDFLGQGIQDEQYEVWLYDTTMMTFTRITTATGSGERGSRVPSLSADGTIVAFYSDSDFLGQGIQDEQYEVWLYDTTTMTLTRVTMASDSNRDSYVPSLSADGTIVALFSDSDFQGQGILDEQYEVWLYDTTTMTFTRVTTATGSGERDSCGSSLSADGIIVAFFSDSDFLGKGIQDDQWEIWMYSEVTTPYRVYLPLVLRQFQ